MKNFQQSPTPTSEPQNSRKRTLRGNSVGSRSHDNAIQKYGRPLLSILSTLVDIALIISFASIIVFPPGNCDPDALVRFSQAPLCKPPRCYEGRCGKRLFQTRSYPFTHTDFREDDYPDLSAPEIPQLMSASTLSPLGPDVSSRLLHHPIRPACQSGCPSNYAPGPKSGIHFTTSKLLWDCGCKYDGSIER